MSKNKRKRRLKEQDFKKKKLKVGKKLPLPDNVTKTNFKARSINIIQNLKPAENVISDDGNKKEGKFKELLNCCSHYNVQARENALIGLKDLFKTHPRILKDNLGQVLQRILNTVTDVHESVRKAFYAIISMIFESNATSDISPFFASIQAHLCSAMTHLSENVCIDSMKFLDLCLKHFPQIVRQDPQTVLSNFINIISVEKHSLYKKSSGSHNVQFQAKTITQTTQLTVLKRLNQLVSVSFKGVVNIKYSTSSKFVTSNDNNDSRSHRNAHTGPTVLRSSHPVFVTNFTLNRASSDRKTTLSNSWLIEFVQRIFPVLLEYWIECCPTEFSTSLIPVPRRSLSLLIMKEMLEIFNSLVESLEKSCSGESKFQDFLRSEMFSQLHTHLIKIFPLSFHVQAGGRKERAESQENITDIRLNMLIAQLLFRLISINPDAIGQTRLTSLVLCYLKNTLTIQGSSKGNAKIGQFDFVALVGLVKMFVFNMPKVFKGEKIQLIRSLYAVQENRSKGTNKMILTSVLAEIVGSASEYGHDMIAVLSDWIIFLLKHLRQDTSEELHCQVLSICKSASLQNFPNLSNCIGETLPRLFQKFSTRSVKAQKLLIELLFYNKRCPSKHLYEVLVRLCHSRCISFEVFEYLLFVLFRLVNFNSNQCTTPNFSNFFSFLFSVIIGYSTEELNKLRALSFEDSGFYSFKDLNAVIAVFDGKMLNFQITKEKWSDLKKISHVICEIMPKTKHPKGLFPIFSNTLSTLFTAYHVLPLAAVYKTLKFVEAILLLANNVGALYDEATLPLEGDSEQYRDLFVALSKWCATVWSFAFKISMEFGKGELIETVCKDVKAVTLQLCKLSEGITENILRSLVPTTLHDDSIRCTCEVITDVFKYLRVCFKQSHRTSILDLYTSINKAFNDGKLDGQTFSDFKYQYQICLTTLGG
ncbi:testis-expressed protein 10 homolog isoform X2 [Xenia sp. Carnegie-2017]|uniref:testis-expressed protein 10 homolog isoform X2 n=1 Tax=Xenia sp. Carnegie-2017 TaxID=2897299 RepID=UPI001F04611E|nr:testis-expressed protein 10 homolog isoform X2 [Xenia sp. Carnegie-2017]